MEWMGMIQELVLFALREATLLCENQPEASHLPVIMFTYAARCTVNKYEVISRWLLTGLAVVLSRQNWQLLAKRGTLTATPQGLLKRYYQIGYPAGLKDKTVLPYALPIHNAITDVEWQRRVRWYCHSRYLADMDTLYAERAGSRFDAFYGTMDLTNPIQAMQHDQTEGEQDQSERAN